MKNYQLNPLLSENVARRLFRGDFNIPGKTAAMASKPPTRGILVARLNAITSGREASKVFQSAKKANDRYIRIGNTLSKNKDRIASMTPQERGPYHELANRTINDYRSKVGDLARKVRRGKNSKRWTQTLYNSVSKNKGSAPIDRIINNRTALNN